jgi:hypothetical protein
MIPLSSLDVLIQREWSDFSSCLRQGREIEAIVRGQPLLQYVDFTGFDEHTSPRNVVGSFNPVSQLFAFGARERQNVDIRRHGYHCPKRDDSLYEKQLPKRDCSLFSIRCWLPDVWAATLKVCTIGFSILHHHTRLAD